MTAEQLFPATVMPDDDWWHALWPDPHKALRDIGITTGMSVIDLCCGNGHFTAPLCELFGPGKVYGVDLDRALLDTTIDLCKPFNNFTPVLGQPRGPDTALRMSPDAVAADIEPAGFRLDRVVDVGPYHYAAIFLRQTSEPDS